METLFSGVERLVSRFSVLDGLIDKVASRVLPERTAQAIGCTQSYCGTGCYNGYRTVKFWWTDYDWYNNKWYQGCGCERAAGGTC